MKNIALKFNSAAAFADSGVKCWSVRRRCIKSIHRGLSRSTQLIFNQDFQGLLIYIIIFGDDGELGEIIMTFSFMKKMKKRGGKN